MPPSLQEDCGVLVNAYSYGLRFTGLPFYGVACYDIAGFLARHRYNSGDCRLVSALPKRLDKTRRLALYLPMLSVVRFGGRFCRPLSIRGVSLSCMTHTLKQRVVACLRKRY